MGTALVMEHANALAQMIVSEKDKLFDERVEALVKLYRRAEFYLKQGFLESIVCEFHRKKVEMSASSEFVILINIHQNLLEWVHPFRLMK